jgi:hypothetical protein
MPKKGDFFFFTQGDYSDYSVYGHFVVLKDFNILEQNVKYNETVLPELPILKYGEWMDNPRRWVKYPAPVDTGKTRPDYHSLDGFQAFLLRQRLVDNLDCRNFHYDNLKEEAE